MKFVLLCLFLISCAGRTRLKTCEEKSWVKEQRLHWTITGNEINIPDTQIFLQKEDKFTVATSCQSREMTVKSHQIRVDVHCRIALAGGPIPHQVASCFDENRRFWRDDRKGVQEQIGVSRIGSFEGDARIQSQVVATIERLPDVVAKRCLLFNGDPYVLDLLNDVVLVKRGRQGILDVQPTCQLP